MIIKTRLFFVLFAIVLFSCNSEKSYVKESQRLIENHHKDFEQLILMANNLVNRNTEKDIYIRIGELSSISTNDLSSNNLYIGNYAKFIKTPDCSYCKGDKQHYADDKNDLNVLISLFDKLKFESIIITKKNIKIYNNNKIGASIEHALGRNNHTFNSDNDSVKGENNFEQERPFFIEILNGWYVYFEAMEHGIT